MPTKATERMLLALHDATTAAHGTHQQVHDAARRWFEQMGEADARSILAARESEAGHDQVEHGGREQQQPPG